MWHEFVADDKFMAALAAEDARTAVAYQARRCPRCEGRLDRADYPRKPRGAGVAADGERYDRRVSLCCAAEGCRRRLTPPSLVFLGRRVYFAVVVLVESLVAAAVSARPARPRRSPPGRTVRRWLDWFRTTLPTTATMVATAGRLWPPLAPARLPHDLVERFVARDRAPAPADVAVAVLRLLSPLSTTTAPPRAASARG